MSNYDEQGRWSQPQQTRRCEWCRAIAHGKCGCDAEVEIDRLRVALQRITHFTSATPGLSQAGCGRVLAQIEHVATDALTPNVAVERRP